MRMVKIYVDDIRPAPDSSWEVERTITGAIRKLATGRVETISLDHDIEQITSGGGISISEESYDTVARYMAILPKALRPKNVGVHSANVWGCKRIIGILREAGYDPVCTSYPGITERNAL